MLWSITYLSIYFLLVNGMLCVFQVRKHPLISALVADPYRGDTVRRLTKNAFDFAIASAIAFIDTMRIKLLANYCNKMLGVS